MKAIFLSLIWCVTTVIALKLLYVYVPAEKQYDLANYFEVYGDENVMDIIMNIFSCIALFTGSLITFCSHLLLKKK